MIVNNGCTMVIWADPQERYPSQIRLTVSYLSIAQLRLHQYAEYYSLVIVYRPVQR